MEPNQDALQQQAPIDLALTEAVTCEGCGNTSFLQSFLIRKVSAIYAPNGEQSLLPIPVFECSSCGHINQMFIPDGLQNKGVVSPLID